MARIESLFRCLSRKLLIPFNRSSRRPWALPAMLAVAAILLLGATAVASAQATQLLVQGYPTDVAAGVPYTGIIYAADDNDDIVNYNGVVTVTTSQNSTGFPVVMAQGAGVFFAAFPTADTSAITPSLKSQATTSQTESITASGSIVDSTGQSVALTSVPETGISVEATAKFVVTTNADDVDDGGINLNPTTNAPYCTDQSLSGATADAHCTLREALYAAANDYWYSEIPEGSTITFSSSAFSTATTITVAPLFHNSETDSWQFGHLYISPATVLTGPTSGSGSAPKNLVTITGGTTTVGTTTYGTSLLIAGDETYYPGVALANLNFTNGDGTDDTGDDWIGGGINNYDTMTVTNCNFTNNKGDGAGAIYNWDGAMLITGGTFSGNTSTGDWFIDAGGVTNDSMLWTEEEGGDATLTGSARPGFTHRSGFDALSAFGVSRHSGAPVGSAAASILSLHNRGNYSSRFAAIKARRDASQSKKDALRKASTVTPALDDQSYYFYGVQELNGVTIAGNSGYYAGGFYNAAYATVYNSTIGQPPSSTTLAGNTGTYVGGLVSDCEEYWVSEGNSNCHEETDNYWDGQTLVANSTINKNAGEEAGGAANWDTATLVAADNTFSNNTSSGIEGPDAGGVETLADARPFFTTTPSTATSPPPALELGLCTSAMRSHITVSTYLVMVSPTMTANSGYYGAAFDDCGFWGCDDSGAEPGYGDRAYNTLIAGNTTTDSTASDDGVSADENGLEARASDSYGSSYTALSALGNYGGLTQTVVPLPGNPAICKPSIGSFYEYLLYMMSGEGMPFLANDQRGPGFPSSNAAYAALSGAEEPCVDSGAVQTNFSLAFTTEPAANVPPASAGTFSAAVTVEESGTPIMGADVSAAPVFVSFTAQGNSTNPNNDPGTLTGGSATTDKNGVATFGSLGIDAPNGTTDYLLASIPLYPGMEVDAVANIRPAEISSNDWDLTAQSTNFTVGDLDFTIAPTSSSDDYQTIVPGTTISFQVTTTPIYPPYYAGPLTISCINNCGLPSGYTVSFTPTTVPANSGEYTFTVKVTAPQAGATTQTVLMQKPDASGTARKFGPLALALLLLPLVGTRRMRRRAGKLARWVCLLVALAAGLAASTLITSCKGNLNGNGYFTQAPQDYNVTVTATAGSYTHTYKFTLNVQ